MLTRHHWVNDLHNAGYRPRRINFPQELSGYLFKTKANHLDGHRLWSGVERDGLRYATLPKTHYMEMATTTQSILARSLPEQGPRLPLLAIRTKVKSMRLMDQNHYVLLAPGIWDLWEQQKKFRTNTRNEGISMEHPWTLSGTLEKLWRNVYARRPQTLFQWQGRQTWAWSSISHTQKTLWMPSCDVDQSLADHSSEGITF